MSDAPADSESQYNGSCHCGQAKYKANLPTDLSKWQIARCNCTLCHKKGYLLIRVRDPATFSFISPTNIDELGAYQHGRKTGHHHFCKNCGTSLAMKGSTPLWGGDYVVINTTTLDDVDLSKIKNIHYWDGRNETKDGPHKEPIAPGAW